MTPAKRSRKKLAGDKATQALIRSARRCPLCFGLEGDSRIKRGQIAHLDRDPSNDASDNLQFLCLPHHDEYDTRTSQSKGMTEGEVRHYAADLDVYVKKMRLEAWPDAAAVRKTSKRRRVTIERCSIAVYNMRLPLFKYELLTWFAGRVETWRVHARPYLHLRDDAI